ncbi:ABC transporter substrate-binding protein [Vogesella facilis]|uniref:ABC transporter substrate-binding protein n=1 Tax=Vogesella facilis TaxID=1655232 RepID=A0ABV7RJ10_9NEIS
MKKALFALSLGGLSALTLAASGDVLKFGTSPAYAPFEYKTASGVAGFDVDLGNEICRRLQAKCVWVENDFDGLIPALKARKFDAILASMNITEARKKQIAFSDRTYNSPTRMVARKGSKLQPTAEALKGLRVGVQQGTVQESYAKKRWEPAGVMVVSYQNQEQVYQDLTSGRIQASLQDAVEAEYGLLKGSKGANFEFAGSALKDAEIFGVGTGIGLRKEDEALRLQINKALAAMLKDGSYQKLAAKYFSFDIYSD